MPKRGKKYIEAKTKIIAEAKNDLATAVKTVIHHMPNLMKQLMSLSALVLTQGMQIRW